MDQQTQSRHSVSNCMACAVQHSKLQQSMPMRPVLSQKIKKILMVHTNKFQENSLLELTLTKSTHCALL